MKGIKLEQILLTSLTKSFPVYYNTNMQKGLN